MLVLLSTLQNSLTETFVRKNIPEVYSNAHVAAKNKGLAAADVKQAAVEARLKFPN